MRASLVIAALCVHITGWHAPMGSRSGIDACWQVHMYRYMYVGMYVFTARVADNCFCTTFQTSSQAFQWACNDGHAMMASARNMNAMHDRPPAGPLEGGGGGRTTSPHRPSPFAFVAQTLHSITYGLCSRYTHAWLPTWPDTAAT